MLIFTPFATMDEMKINVQDDQKICISALVPNFATRWVLVTSLATCTVAFSMNALLTLSVGIA